MSNKDRVRAWMREHGARAEGLDAGEVADMILADHPDAGRRATTKRNVLFVRAEIEQGLLPEIEETPGHEGTQDAGDPEGERFEVSATTYTFHVERHSLTLPHDEVEDIVWWYTNMGGKLSARRTCEALLERHGRHLTEDWLRKVLRMLGVRKTSAPFAPHTLAKYDEVELKKIRLTRQQAEAGIALRRDESRHWRKLWEGAQREMARQDRVVDLLAEAVSVLEPRPRAPLQLAETDRIALAAAYDVHIGKLASGHGLEQSVATFVEAGEQLARTLAQMGAPRKIVAVFGGDYFHADAAEPHKASGGRTTRGTPQDMDCSPAEMLRAGIRAAVRYVEDLSSVAPVEVIVIPGNHDEVLTGALSSALELVFTHYPRVTVDWQDASRRYVRHGACLIGLEHGDGPKPRDLGMIMAHERPQDWGATRWRYFVTGHLHHTHERELGGVHLLQAPSLAVADRWHHKQGYVTCRPAHRAYLFDGLHGLVASLTAQG